MDLPLSSPFPNLHASPFALSIAHSPAKASKSPCPASPSIPTFHLIPNTSMSPLSATSAWTSSSMSRSFPLPRPFSARPSWTVWPSLPLTRFSLSRYSVSLFRVWAKPKFGSVLSWFVDFDLNPVCGVWNILLQPVQFWEWNCTSLVVVRFDGLIFCYYC